MGRGLGLLALPAARLPLVLLARDGFLFFARARFVAIYGSVAPGITVVVALFIVLVVAICVILVIASHSSHRVSFCSGRCAFYL